MLPPGLRGFVAAEDQRGKNEAQQLGMLAQLAQLQRAQQQHEMERQMMPLKVKALLAELTAKEEAAKATADKRAFFSPENTARYTTPGSVVQPDPQELQQSADQRTPAPQALQVPGQMNFNRFLQDAATRGFIAPETYANHIAQQEQKKADAQQRADLKRDELTSRETIAREKLENDFRIAKEKAEDKRASDAERIAARKEMMYLAASLRQPQRDRLAYDSARGGTVNLDTSEFTPAMQGGEVVGAKPTPEKAMPASAVKSLMENQQNLRRAEQALALVQGKNIGTAKGDTGAVGLKGMLSGTEVGDQLLQRLDPAGVDTRAAISDLGSMIIHDRSGAAVTAAEYPRLRPFIPKTSDNAETAKKKLERFVTEYRNVQQEAVDFFQESGYRVPVNSLRPPAAPQRRASDGAKVLRFDAQGNAIP